MNHRRRFAEIWGRAIGDKAALAWQALDRNYRNPSRAYHNWPHIEAMLTGLDSVRSELEFGPVAFEEVELAIWFHDAVYDPIRKDNELRSAGLFKDMAGAGPTIGPSPIQRIVEMIVATQSHAPSDDMATRLLLDLDLSVLGAGPARYDAYVAAVRREYAFVDEAAWRTGRAAVLAHFLERHRLFQTDKHHALFEASARDNLAREIAALQN